MFEPLEKREPISKVIAVQLEEAILSKKFLPGTKLPSEAELCEKFNVSRTPLREAIKLLSAHGFVTVHKGKGVFVNELSSKDISLTISKYLRQKLDKNYVLDIVKARKILEPSIAYSASLNRTEEDLNKLRANLEDLKNCCDGYDKLSQIDMKFHILLAKASNNRVVPLLLNSLFNLLPEFNPSVYAANEDAKELAFHWHGIILSHVINKDAGAATIAMSDHLQIAEDHAKNMLMIKSKLEENNSK